MVCVSLFVSVFVFLVVVVVVFVRLFHLLQIDRATRDQLVFLSVAGTTWTASSR